jgi:hypothetical protein
MLSALHFSWIIVSIYFYNQKLWGATITIVYVVVPFKDGCIALLMTRLYYYQGTSENRNKKVVIEEEN